MKYQVISRDYNGTTTILSTETELNSAVTKIKSEVTDINFNNALTTDNKFKSIEAFFPQFINESGEIQEEMVYAGESSTGARRVYSGGSLQDLDGSSMPRFYIGDNEGKHHFLEDHKNNFIEDWKNEGLDSKTYFFIKVLA